MNATPPVDHRRQALLRVNDDRITVQTWPVTQEAANFDLVVERGATLDLLIQWLDETGQPRELTLWTPSVEVRTTPGAAGDPLASWGVGTGELILDETSRAYRLRVPAAQTAALAPWVRAHYDLRLTDGTVVLYLFRGEILQRNTVTQPSA